MGGPGPLVPVLDAGFVSEPHFMTTQNSSREFTENPKAQPADATNKSQENTKVSKIILFSTDYV